jgi:integrase
MLPHEINRDNLAEWYAWWPKNKPDVEIENAIKWMRNFCKYLSQKVVGGFPVLPAVPRISDPNRKQRLIARANKKERIFTPQEIKTIRNAAESWIHALMVQIMTTMATRIDETLKLEFGKTIFLDEEIPVYRWFAGQNKADLVGQHALHLSLIEPLTRLREIRRAEGTALLFPQKYNNQAGLSEQQIDWASWRKRANLGWHWTPHTCRHYCLTTVFNNPKVPQLAACKQYRVSAKVAEETYVKTTKETMILLRDIIEAEP